MTNRCVALVLMLALTLLAAPVLAGVDTETHTKAKIKSTIDPSGEVEVFRVDAIAGSELTLSLKEKSGDLDLDVEVRDPADTPLDLNGAASYSNTGSRVSVKKLHLPTTGEHEIRVTAIGTGDYQLKIKCNPEEDWGETVTIPAGDDRAVTFSCPEGSSVKIKVKASKKSGVEPRCADLDGDDLSNLGSIKSYQHKVKLTDVAGGDHTLTIDNLGATSGDVKVSIAVSPPDVSKDKLDFRGETLGTESGGEAVLGRAVDTTGETLTVDDAAADLDGASVMVPPSALSARTRILLMSAPAPDAPDPETDQLAGPTLEVDAGGASFAQPVRVTVPYDPTLIPADRDPLTDLRVLRVTDGTATELSPVTGGVDTVNNRITVETTGFSTFTPVVPKGAPRLQGRSYWHLFFEFSFESDPLNDSRVRRLYMGGGSVTLGAPKTSSSFPYSGSESSIRIDVGDNRVAYAADLTDTVPANLDGQVSFTTEAADFPNGTWEYGDDGQTIEVSIEPDETMTYWMSSDGSILISDGEAEPTDPNGFLDIAIEQHPTATVSSVAGKYHVGEVEFSTWSSPSAPPHFSFYRVFATLTLKSDGTFSYSAEENEIEWDGWDSAWDQDEGSGSTTGTFTVSGGKITLSYLDDGDPATMEIMVGCGGEVLLAGVAESDGGWAAGMIILGTKQGSGLKTKDLAGKHRSACVEWGPSSYQVNFFRYDIGIPPQLINQASLTAGDFEFRQLGEDWTFLPSSKRLTITDGTDKLVRRDINGSNGLTVSAVPSPDLNLDYEVSGKGRVKASRGSEYFIGGMTSDGLFSWLIDDPGRSIRVWGLSVQVKLPVVK